MLEQFQALWLALSREAESYERDLCISPHDSMPTLSSVCKDRDKVRDRVRLGLPRSGLRLPLPLHGLRLTEF